jgi:hypothetical protein
MGRWRPARLRYCSDCCSMQDERSLSGRTYPKLAWIVNTPTAGSGEATRTFDSHATHAGVTPGLADVS